MLAASKLYAGVGGDNVRSSLRQKDKLLEEQRSYATMTRFSHI